MKLLLLLLSTVFITVNVFSQNVTVYEESSPGACDGYAILDPTSINSSENYTWLITTQDSIIQGSLTSNTDTLSNLCDGYYALQYHDSLFLTSNFDTLYYYFSVTATDTTCSYFSVNGWATNETLAGTCDGTINSSVSGENGTVSYSWSNGASTQNITNLCTGTYVITATDTAACVAQGTFTVGSNTICSNFDLTATSTGETLLGCDGTATAVVSNANGTVTYLWSTGSTLSSINSLCPGVYTISVTDSAACSDSLQVYIDQDTTCSYFSINGLVTNETLAGTCDGVINTNVSWENGTVSYSWSNGASTQNITNLCAGTYLVTATDTAACVAQETFTVGSNTICTNFNVTASSTPETSIGACDGTAVASSSNENGWVTYSWSNGGTTTIATGLCEGTHVVTATDSASCTSTYTVYVDTDSTNTAALQLIISTSNESFSGACDGIVNAMVSGGVQPYSYSYSFGGANAPTNSSVCTGYYTVVVYDAMGDSITGSFIITSPVTTFDTYNYSDSTITDTVFTTPIETCLIDFATIDSAFVANTVFLGNDSLQLTWTIIDSNGTQQITTYYYVGGLSQGVYTFSLSLFCGTKAADNVFTLIDSYYIEPTSLGINDLIEESIVVYPNPFMDKFTIQFPSNMVGGILMIVDVNGRVVLESSIKFEKQELQMSNIPNGQYLIVTDQSSTSIRIQKN